MSEEIERIEDVIFTPKKKSKFWFILFTLGTLTVLGAGIIYFLSQEDATDSFNTSGGIEVGPPSWKKDLNKEFSFSLRDSYGNTVSSIVYSIETAELRTEIIVKGQRVTSVKGKIFLILNLKIANEYEQAIEIDSRNYVRLMRNGYEDEKLAPDIHNDPIEIQAFSTKISRLGFPINDTDKDLILQVGELDGPKEVVKLE